MISSQRPKLLLIDGFHTAFRAFYALPSLTTRQGLPTNAVYGFLQIVRKLLRELQPELAAVAWDVSERTFRTELFADYKANRAPMPEELRVQIPYLRRAMEALRLPVLELEQFEADDVMGTIARKAAESGYEVILVSSDKDLLQLVTPEIRLFHTGRNRLYGPDEVLEDYGLRPDQIPDYLALVGDASDNLPGVPGIGEKGAQKLLAEFGNLEGLLSRVEELQRKAYRDGLKEHGQQALFTRELATIHTDLPIPFDPEHLRIQPSSQTELRELAQELELRTVLEELQAPCDLADPSFKVRLLDSVESLEELFHLTTSSIFVAWLGKGEPEAVALAGPSGQPVGFDLRSEPLRRQFAERLRRQLETRDCLWYGHDLKELLRLAPNVRPQGKLFDLLLVSYLLNASSPGPSLEELSRQRLGQDLSRIPKNGTDLLPLEDLGQLLSARFAATRALSPLLEQEIRSTPQLLQLYTDLEAPLLPVLIRMEQAGILLDCDLLDELAKQIAAELAALETRAFELAGVPFNLNSPQQLGTVLFERLGLPTLRKTRKKRAWSTDADTLQELARLGHELPQLLLRYRELAKLKSTYVEALPALVGPDGRLHTRYQQAVAATGRLSSVNPNLQNIPVRTELGQKIRRAFRAPKGAVLLAADYSQIELRVLAHISQDEQLLQAFRRGEDIHRTTASLIFNIPASQVTPEQRRAAKTINFGLIYGMSPYGLSQSLGVSQVEAEQFIHAYFARFGGVQRYMRQVVEQAEREGKVVTLFGRVRPLPELSSPSFTIRENAKRIAINTPIQGTAADILKRAMLRIDDALFRAGLETRLLLTVHDELVLEVPEGELETVKPLVQRAMESAAELDVPLEVEIGWGPTWADAKS